MGKNQNNLTNSLLAIFVLYLFIIAFSIISTKSIKLDTIILVIYAIGLLFSYIKTKNKEQIGGVVGLIVSILMMVTIINHNVMIFLLGLFVFIYSIKYLKEFK